MITTPRLLLRFVLGGLVVFGLARVCGVAGDEVLRVEVPAGSDAAAIDRAIDEVLLLEHAEQADWPRRDAIVRARLLALLDAVDARGDDPEAALAQAIADGLHRRDPIARQRLLLAATRSLGEASAPWRGGVLSEYAVHADRHVDAARTRFSQAFVSCGAGDCAARAAAIARVLEGRPADTIVDGADPWPWTRDTIAYADTRLDAAFGPGFAQTLAAAPVGRWSGPWRSAFGLHVVFVHAREHAAPRSIADVLPRVQASLELADRSAALQAALVQARRGRRIEVVSTP